MKMLQVGGEESVFSRANHGGFLAEQGRQGQSAIFDSFTDVLSGFLLDIRMAVRISGSVRFD
jgi:hypothetical protein